jgi:hypothetical protein
MREEKRSELIKKLSERREINLIFTDFKKEIKKVKQKLQICVNLQHYYARNYLFELQKNAQKEEKVLLNWLLKLREGQKDYKLLL